LGDARADGGKLSGRNVLEGIRGVKRKRTAAIIVILLLPALMLIFRFRATVRGFAWRTVCMFVGKATVADRIRQYGPTAGRRLAPRLKEKGLPYPPGELVLVGLKHERVLELWARGGESDFFLVRTYPILAASGRLGPKLREGDRQVPEGLYRIESLNPNSSYHLSLRLNYPNKFDRRHAREEGRNEPGSDIMIHGSNVSIGCIAVGDEAAEDLFVLVAETGIENVSVILAPVDFRRRQMPALNHELPSWTAQLYRRIREELRRLSSGS